MFGEAFDKIAIIEFPKVFSSHQLEMAKLLHIRNAQEPNFLEEIHALKEGEPTKISSKLLKLNPFLDINGVLRMNSRLEHHEAYPDQIRRPVILPKETKITELIVLQIHSTIVIAFRWIPCEASLQNVSVQMLSSKSFTHIHKVSIG